MIECNFDSNCDPRGEGCDDCPVDQARNTGSYLASADNPFVPSEIEDGISSVLLDLDAVMREERDKPPVLY